MNEEEIGQAWTTLEPGAEAHRRMRTRVFSWLDAHDTSLAAEWLGLFRVAPFAAIGLVSASAVLVVVTTPLLWIVRGMI